MILFFASLFSFLFCQQELIDGVVATVGDKTILFSEVLSETRMLAEQKNISPQNSPLMFQKLFLQNFHPATWKIVVFFYLNPSFFLTL